MRGLAYRNRLLSHTALATTILLGGLVLARPADAGDVTGVAGSNGAGGSSAPFPPELIAVEGAGITVSKVTGPAIGGSGGPGGPGMGIPPILPGENSNGTGGIGGLAAEGASGDIGALDIILNEDVDNPLGVTLTTGAATGGNGGAGGNGFGGVAGNGTEGADGNPGDTGGDGGTAVGTGGAGAVAGAGQAGDIGPVTVDVTGNIISTTTLELTGGVGTGGNGGLGGHAQGGAGGAGGIGGTGQFLGAASGAGGAGGDANGAGGDGGIGASGVGGSVGSVEVSASGDIRNTVLITATAGDGHGGMGGPGGSGLGGTGLAGGAGGIGFNPGALFGAFDNAAGGGGQGGTGASAIGTGGDGNIGGKGFGGDIGDVEISAGGALAGDVGIEMRAGDATGGAGGAGGPGQGGGAGSGGPGGAAGGIGNVIDGKRNYGGNGGAGGVSGVSSGFGGIGRDGGGAEGGSTGAVTLDVLGTLTGAVNIKSTGGSAAAGDGGNGGDASGNIGASGATGGAGGPIPLLGGGNNAISNMGGNGGQGGDGSASLSSAGNGGNGGHATGGSAGAVTINRVAATSGTIAVTSTGGDANGGDGGTGGIAKTSQASNGGAGGMGGNLGTPNDAGDVDNIAGNGGKGGAGGSKADAAGGNGGHGGGATAGDADVSISNSGVFTSAGAAIAINAFGGNAVGGAGADGGDATAGKGGTGGAGGAAGTGGNGPGVAGTGGDGGAGGDARGGVGGNGGNATAGSANVGVTNSGDINSVGTAITIIASGGLATGGRGGTGGDATAGVGGAAGAGGTAGANGSAAGGNGGNGGTAQGGDATVIVSNDGRIFSMAGNGIDITTTSGGATFGAGAYGGGASAITAPDPGDMGQDGFVGSSNGASAITVDNTNLIDVSGIGVKATANGDNGTIKVNNTGGTIDGDLGGIVVATDLGFIADSDIDIVNSGVIMAGNGMAINAKGASAEILNAGEVVGYIDLTAQDDTFDNQAGSVFAARGASTFGSGSDIYNNLAGSMLDTADAPGMVEEAEFNGIEQFRNSGLISMFDHAAGDKLTMSADAGDVAYSSSGGRVDVDAVLGDAVSGKSDLLIINGNVVASPTGPTTATQVAVNVVGTSGANADGIAVIEVTGDTVAGDFVLAGGPLNVGLFAWDLRLDEGGHVFELFTSGAGTAAYEFAAGLTATQDIWYQTTGTLLQRQADLRPLIAGTQVTPVADYSEPVAPTPAGQVGPGFWLKGVGAYLERDQGDGIAVTDRKQSIYGGLAGFDFATEGNGDAWLFGLFGGYLASDLKFTETDTKWTYDGPSLGAYATYLNDALYVDMVVKADFLSINIDPDTQGADDEDTDAVNLGGLIDAGYKFGSGEGVFVEPQAALAVVHTSIDDVDMLGGTIDFDEETSVRGRLGLRLGYDHTAANQVVYSSDVTASVWQEFNGASNDVSIGSAGFPAFGVSDEPGETVGDISLGLSVAALEGWSGFLRGTYQFSDDLEAISGSAGVRYSW